MNIKSLVSKLFISANLLFGLSCSNTVQVDFYQQKRVSEGHSDCFPIIKPYKAVDIHINGMWESELFNDKRLRFNPDQRISRISFDSLNILGSIIIAKCSRGDCFFDGITGPYFCIIIPSEEREEVFVHFEDFLKFLENRNLKEPIIFFSAQKVNEEWQDSSKLPWGRVPIEYERQLE